MKDYIIEVKDGHHHVRILSDEEIQQYKAAAEAIVQFVQNLFDAVKETVENIVTGLRAWIEENIIIELLEEYENELNSRKISTAIGDASRVRQPNTDTQLGGFTDGMVHGAHRMGEHARTL